MPVGHPVWKIISGPSVCMELNQKDGQIHSLFRAREREGIHLSLSLSPPTHTYHCRKWAIYISHTCACTAGAAAAQGLEHRQTGQCPGLVLFVGWHPVPGSHKEWNGRTCGHHGSCLGFSAPLPIWFGGPPPPKTGTFAKLGSGQKCQVIAQSGPSLFW